MTDERFKTLHSDLDIIREGLRANVVGTNMLLVVVVNAVEEILLELKRLRDKDLLPKTSPYSPVKLKRDKR